MYNPEDLTKNIKLKLLTHAVLLTTFCSSKAKFETLYSQNTVDNTIVFNYVLLHQRIVYITDFWAAVKKQKLYKDTGRLPEISAITTYWVTWGNTGNESAFESLYDFTTSKELREKFNIILKEVQKLKGLLPRSLNVQL